MKQKKHHQLEKLRKKVDTIDLAIMKLLQKRLKTTLSIGAYKHKNNLPISQKEREKAAMLNRIKVAKKMGIQTSLIQNLFRFIVSHAKSIQIKRYNQKSDFDKTSKI